MIIYLKCIYFAIHAEKSLLIYLPEHDIQASLNEFYCSAPMIVVIIILIQNR